MMSSYQAIVIGASAGGLSVIRTIVTSLPADFKLPIAIVQHIGSHGTSHWIKKLDSIAAVKVKEADEKESLAAGYVYFAPPNYHLLVEEDHTFTLTLDERVHYARPAIDVLFETAAVAYRKRLIGIILTGANFDGAMGLKHIGQYGGLTIVQDPETAEAYAMPNAAIKSSLPDYVLSPNEIIELLKNVHQGMTAKPTI